MAIDLGGIAGQVYADAAAVRMDIPLDFTNRPTKTPQPVNCRHQDLAVVERSPEPAKSDSRCLSELEPEIENLSQVSQQDPRRFVTDEVIMHHDRQATGLMAASLGVVHDALE